MLGKADATPMIAVKDLDRARSFYEGTLGLSEVDDFGEAFMLKSGDTTLSVYRSEFAGTNKATTLTFNVDDLDLEVSELKGKGISFEHYDLRARAAPRSLRGRRRLQDRLVQGPGPQHPEP